MNGLLGDLASMGMGAMHGIGGLLGVNPQSQAPTQTEPQQQDIDLFGASAALPYGGNVQPVAAPQAPQAPQEGFLSKAGHFLFGGGQGDPNDPLGRFRPGLVQEALGAAMLGGNPWAARDMLTRRNIAQANMGRQQQFVQALYARDPAEAQAYMMDPKGYMDARYGAHTLKPGEVQYVGGKPIAGAPADIAPEHTLVSPVTGGQVFSAPLAQQKLGPNETTYNPNTGQGFTAPPAPMVVGSSDSVFANGAYHQAPAKAEVVTTPAGSTTSLVYPSATGGTAAPGGTASATGAPPMPAGTPPLPRGLRNNNPLNLTPLPKGQWAGQVGTDGRYAQFDNVQDGLAAADKNLAAKQSLHGLNTLEGVIADKQYGWDPGNLGYADTVANDLGIRRDTPLNLQDPGVRARVLASMQKVELGPQAAAQVPQAQGQGAPVASGVQTLVRGAMPRDVPPAEAIAKGFAPGRWQQLPNGDYKQASPAPKGDVERVNNLVSAASTMDDLMDLDHQFMQAAGRTPPGLVYAGGEKNPIAKLAELTNPDVKTMESIGAQELFKMKPDNAGARILQSELPFWERSALDAGSSLEANRGLAAQHAAQAAQIKAKAEFYQTWLYEHGNLNGADQAWARAKSHAQQTAGTQQQADPLAAARDAIRRGAPRAAVIQRLRDNGINPAGL